MILAHRFVAIGRDAEDAAAADAERAAENIARAYGSAWLPGRNYDEADDAETAG